MSIRWRSTSLMNVARRGLLRRVCWGKLSSVVGVCAGRAPSVAACATETSGVLAWAAEFSEVTVSDSRRGILPKSVAAILRRSAGGSLANWRGDDRLGTADHVGKNRIGLGAAPGQA